MTESLKLSAEARADWNKEQERIQEEQQARIDVTVDEWMQDEGTVEKELLEAVQEVSGDMAPFIIYINNEMNNDLDKERLARLSILAMVLLVTQIRKQMRESVEEHLYG